MNYTTKNGFVISDGDLIFNHFSPSTRNYSSGGAPCVFRVEKIDGGYAKVKEVFDGAMEPVENGFGLSAYSLDFATPLTKETAAENLSKWEETASKILSNHRKVIAAIQSGVQV